MADATSALTALWAESCTAGALAVLLPDAPHAAQMFHGGFVVYTKQNKTAVLGVPANHGLDGGTRLDDLAFFVRAAHDEIFGCERWGGSSKRPARGEGRTS